MSNVNYKNTLSLTIKILILYFLLGASSVFAASLSLSPATGVYSSGQTFTARVLVNTSGASINAADGTISFNPNELSVVALSKGPIFNLWTAEPSFSNAVGTINFSGGSPTGYTGGAGTVLNVTFRTKGSGPTKVNFSSGSVLAADGRGTNVLTNMAGGAYTISAAAEVPEAEAIIEYVPAANTPGVPKIESTTHPDPESWYQSKEAELSWNLPNGVTAVRTLLDKSPTSIPSKVYDPAISDITLSELEEGIQYFHLQLRNADGWGGVAHYRLAVDDTSPSDLKLRLAENSDPSSPTQIIQVSVIEETSSISKYEVRLNGADSKSYEETGSSTITIEDLEPGSYSAVVEAFDAAGNSVVENISFAVAAFDKPVFTEYPSEINEEVIPVIKGLTRPNAEVEVSITQIGLTNSTADAQKKYVSTSNSEGEFTVIPDGTFSLGVYELVAVATDQFGAKSDPSDPVRIAVQRPGYLQLGSLAISVLSVLIPLLALCGLLVLGLWYFMLLLGRTKRSVEREAGEAMTILKREFNALQAELDTHGKALAQSRRTKKLTKAEAQVIDSIKSSLKVSQKKVEKEIADVEDIVD